MAYTEEQCNEVLEKLREASVKLASQTIKRASVNGVEYDRNSLNELAVAIDYWQGQLLIAERKAGKFGGASINWSG